MAQEIFRKQALERLASPEQLDLLMPITRPRAWVALVGIGLLLIAALVWSVFGSIKTVVDGYGFLDRASGVVNVVAPAVGWVESVSAKVGETVEQGQVLALIRPAEPPSSNGVPVEGINVVATIKGRVLDIPVKAGQLLSASQVLMSLENQHEPLVGVVYVAVPDAYQVNVNDGAKVLPATSTKHEAGYLLGHVSYAGRYPVSTEQTSAWWSDKTAMRPLLKFEITFDSATASNDLFSGTPCQAMITVEERRPWEIVFAGIGE